MTEQKDRPFLSFRAKRLERSQSMPISKSRKPSKKLISFVVLISLLILAGLYFFFTHSDSSVAKFVFPNQIKKTDDRVNVLLLGIGGGKHDGALLTDSIIVASFNTKTKRAVLISVPRDLYLGSIKEKVNAAYEVGLLKNDGNGLGFAEDKLDDILGIPIHYGILMDFSAFERAIDLVEGIDVEVPQTFDDYEYPITGKENDLCGNKEEEVELDEEKAKVLNLKPGKHKLIIDPEGKVATTSAQFGCRFEHLSFKRGPAHLDGETALKFVRSRHGTNGEGSDFARSRRQQIVIEAFKSKVLSLGTFTNPQKVFGLVDTFGKSVVTDLPKDRFLEFYNMVKSIKTTESIVLGDLGNGKSLFVNPPVSQYGAWVLIPPEEDFSPVVDLVRRALEATSTAVLVPTPSPLPSAKTK